MKIAKFTDMMPGRLVRVELPEPDWAFIPDTLPGRWEFPNEFWPHLMEARESIARLDGIGRTLPHPELLLTPLQSREALRSSSLEGTYALPEQLIMYQMNPRQPRSEQDPANDWREVANYADALREGCTLMLQLPFSLRLIRQLHKVLLDGVRGRDKRPGEFRTCQVHIGSDRRFVPPPAPRVDECMNALETYINDPRDQLDPLVRAFLIHYQFEAIHPFLDGNGRLGRVLLSLMIYKWCNLHLPWLYLSAFFEKYKDEYIGNLFRVSTHGDWTRWIGFCLTATIEQAKDSIARCERLNAVKRAYHEKVGGAPRLHGIIDRLFASPMLKITTLARAENITYPTAKSDIETLVTHGILKVLPEVRPKAYFAPEIFQIAYSDEI